MSTADNTSHDRPEDRSERVDRVEKQHGPDPAQHGGTSDAVDEKTHQTSDGRPSSGPAPKPEQSKEQQPPGGYDATPLPRGELGYKVKITFHRATALPIADAFSLSSDPYINAELQTDLPTRHKEDPPLRFRTRTIFRNTAPVWEEEWILDNVPASGFKMKARIYDEDRGDADDRLGNAHITVGRIDEKWDGIRDQGFKIKKRMGSKRAYLLRAFAVCTGQAKEMSGQLFVSVEVLGRTPGREEARVYTTGLNYWCKHYSPLLGRIAGSKSTQDDSDLEDGEDREAREPAAQSANDHEPDAEAVASEKRGEVGEKLLRGKSKAKTGKKHVARYSFEANQMQLKGPVPAELYHRYVEFRPFIRMLFTASGIRGIILHKALHHQHSQVYNFNPNTKYGVFRQGPCDAMTQRFLNLCHYGEGGRIFTYVLSLDALLRFTETGKEFGIDLLSKHTMHSDASIYIAYSGEFFIRKRKSAHRPTTASAASDQDAKRTSSRGAEHSHGSPDQDAQDAEHSSSSWRHTASHYELVIDNDSGTYRPNAALLPLLHSFLSSNFPGLKVVTLDCQKDKELMDKLKAEQREKKRRANQGPDGRQMVYTQGSNSSSSLSSSDVDRLERREDDAMVEERFRREENAGTGESRDESGAAGSNGTSDADAPQPRHRLGEAILPYVQSQKVRNHLMTRPGAKQ